MEADAPRRNLRVPAAAARRFVLTRRGRRRRPGRGGGGPDAFGFSSTNASQGSHDHVPLPDVPFHRRRRAMARHRLQPSIEPVRRAHGGQQHGPYRPPLDPAESGCDLTSHGRRPHDGPTELTTRSPTWRQRLDGHGCRERRANGPGTAAAGDSCTGAGRSCAGAGRHRQRAKKPNILFIMGDDIGWSNIGVYNQGIMAGRTPNLDQLAAEGMRFTDYYAEASCTAGRANFITGELPIRTGLTTVGQAGSPIGMPGRGADHRHGAEVAWATPPASSARTTSATSTSSCRRCTASTSSSATSTTSTRWRTRRTRNYPQDLQDRGRAAQHGPFLGHRHGRSDRQPRWGKVGKQKIEDAGPLYPERMKTVDDEILRQRPSSSSTRPRPTSKPFFVWLNPTRMHVVTHLSDKYEAMRNAENGWSEQEAGMAQLDDIVGSVMKYLKDQRPRRQHHRRLHHRQRRRELHLARRRPDALRRRQGHGARRRLPRAGDHPLAGQGAGRQGRERHRLRPRLVPDPRRGGRQPEHRRRAEDRARSSATRPTRCISTATTRPT